MPGSETETANQDMNENVAVTPSHGWAWPTDQVTDAHLISPLQYFAQGSDSAPLNRIKISARLDMGMPLASIESPYHEIALSPPRGCLQRQAGSG